LAFSDGVFCVGDSRNKIEPGFLCYSLRGTIPDHRLKFNDLKPDMLKGQPVTSVKAFVATPSFRAHAATQ